MNLDFIPQIFHTFFQEILTVIETIGPKLLGAGIVIVVGAFISYGVYKLVMYIFQKFGIVEFVEKLWDGFEEQTTQIVDKNLQDNAEKQEEIQAEKTEEKPKKIRYDKLIAKSISYYIFLLFFRWAVVIIGITDVEDFLQDLIAYLPSLFIGIMIGFFGLRFANSVYDIIYQALELTKDKTSKIIAMAAKVIIMFFTLMIMLNYIKIVDKFVIDALFIGFITTLTLSFGLSFGLGGKDIAKQILESFKK